MPAPVLIDGREVKRLARLARLRLEPAQLQSLGRDLAQVLEWMGQLGEVDVSQIEPMVHPHADRLSLRLDLADGGAPREELQRSAPSTEAGYYLVPPVID